MCRCWGSCDLSDALGIPSHCKLTLVQILIQKNFVLLPGGLHMSTPRRSLEIVDLSEKTSTIMFQLNIPDM